MYTYRAVARRDTIEEENKKMPANFLLVCHFCFRVPSR